MPILAGQDTCTTSCYMQARLKGWNFESVTSKSAKRNGTKSGICDMRSCQGLKGSKTGISPANIYATTFQGAAALDCSSKSWKGSTEVDGKQQGKPWGRAHGAGYLTLTLCIDLARTDPMSVMLANNPVPLPFA